MSDFTNGRHGATLTTSAEFPFEHLNCSLFLYPITVILQPITFTHAARPSSNAKILSPDMPVMTQNRAIENDI